MSDQINIHMNEGQRELVILTGESLPIKEPTRINITGQIGALYAFLRDKAGNYDPKWCHVLSSDDKINLILNETGGYEYGTVTGILKKHDDVALLGINVKQYTLEELRVLVKFKPWHFDPAQRGTLLRQLMEVEIKINTRLENKKSDDGSSKVSAEKLLDHLTLEKQVPVKCATYQGQEREFFECTLEREVVGDTVRFMFYSERFAEKMEAYRETAIEQELQKIAEIFPCSQIRV